MSQAVLVEKQGAVALITLNRPERRNALNHAMVEGLIEALAEVREDASVRAVVLTGSGKSFCAGADLSQFTEGLTPEAGRDYLIRYYQPLMRDLISLRKPILGAINGVAAGAGAALALACDLRVMAEDAALLYAFINLGLGPDAGASWLLARQVGYSRAFEIAITGAPLPASDCLPLGLTNRVVSSDQLLQETLTWAEQLATRPTLAIGLTKAMLYQALQIDLPEAIAFEAKTQMEAFASHDLQEGLAAFLQKRPPHFTGR